MTKIPNSNTTTPPANNSIDKDPNNPVDISEALSIGWKIFKENILISIALIIVPLIIQFIPIAGPIINLIIAPGIVYVFIKLYDKQPTSFGNIFTRIDKIFPYLGIQIIVGLIVMGGSLFLIIPGFIAQIALFFAIFLLIDKNMSIMESIRTSWAITKGHRGKLFLFVIISGLISIPIALLTLGIGLAIVIPVIFFASFHIYRKLLAQAEKNNKIPVTKLQTWPKVFLWVGVLLIPLGILASIVLVTLGPARQKAQEYHQNQMEQIDDLQNDLQDNRQDNLSDENTMENTKSTTNNAM